MRKRWKVPEEFLWFLIGVWAIGWLPIFLVLWALLEPQGLNTNGTPNPIPPLFIGTWLVGPLLVLAAARIPKGVAYLWRHRPRRVLESSPDIREVYRRD